MFHIGHTDREKSNPDNHRLNALERSLRLGIYGHSNSGIDSLSDLVVGRIGKILVLCAMVPSPIRVFRQVKIAYVTIRTTTGAKNNESFFVFSKIAFILFLFFIRFINFMLRFYYFSHRSDENCFNSPSNNPNCMFRFILSSYAEVVWAI